MKNDMAILKMSLGVLWFSKGTIKVNFKEPQEGHSNLAKEMRDHFSFYFWINYLSRLSRQKQ